MFHILVVEDNANTRKLMEAVLTQHGYEPILACDGVEALEVLDRKHVDLIVLDIMMPRMDGYEFTETLRQSGCDLPILMVTAKEKPADKHRGFQIGTDDYMVKPVDEEEMILRIAALLRRSRIVNEHKLTVGGTVLDYDALSVRTPEGEREVYVPDEALRETVHSLRDARNLLAHRHQRCTPAQIDFILERESRALGLDWTPCETSQQGAAS